MSIKLLPFFISSHSFEKLLYILLITQFSKIFFQILNCLMMSQNISSSSSNVGLIEFMACTVRGGLRLAVPVLTSVRPDGTNGTWSGAPSA